MIFKYFVLLILLFLRNILAQEALPAKEVFIPKIQQIQDTNGDYRTEIKIDFPKNYYLYADKTTLNGSNDYTSTPVPEIKEDKFLGQTAIWHEPPTLITHLTGEITLKTQGCLTDTLCYPPTTWTLKTEALPSKNLFGKKVGTQATAEVFNTIFAFENNGDLRVEITVPPEHYLYRGQIQAEIDGKALPIHLPAGEKHHDDFLGEQEIYRENLNFLIENKDLNGKALFLSLQGCHEGRLCYPPVRLEQALPEREIMEEKPIQTSTSDFKPSASDDFVQRLNENFVMALLLVFGVGLLTSFTACIYPLIPIVSGLVVGDNVAPSRAYRLILTYVLAMGLAMALLGAIFSLFAINLQVLLQKAWISFIVGFIFIVLSLSLFNLFVIQTPTFLQKNVDKLNNQQQAGSYLGAFIMGALSVLVVSPCATPILTALLLFTAQTTPLKGALALFVFGFATGVPLLLFASALKKYLPKAGAWMNTIKTFFAFALLAIGIWLMVRSASDFIFNLAWTAYLLFVSVYLLPKKFPPETFKEKSAFYFSLLALILAFSFSHQIFSNAPVSVNEPQKSASGALKSALFEYVDDEKQIAQIIKNSNQPIILDFYADWCVSCKVWERDIWQNPQLKSAFENFKMIKIDVTDFQEKHQVLFQRLNMVAPPAVFIYRPNGDLSRPQDKIIGEMSAEVFAEQLKNYF